MIFTDPILRSVFLALALRFDYHLALERAAVPFKPHGQHFSKPYFHTCFVAYVLGPSSRSSCARRSR